jgi:hypothetical protein
MNQLSSNATLFFKIFLPTFWLTFFGAVCVASIFVVEEPYFLGYKILQFRIGSVLFWLSGFALFYFTVFKLKRVDADDESLYVSSYFRNFRYPFTNIEKIVINEGNFLSFGYIHLLVAGSFGKKITFLASRKGLYDYLDKNPAAKAMFDVQN